MAKIRLDELVLQQGLAETLTQARALIMSGKIRHGDRRLDKAGEKISEDLELSLDQPDHPWVSRGGLKLQKAVETFFMSGAQPFSNMVAADIGASTGGFTDVLLHYGAAKVYAVDVGYGQLHEKLRADPRVVVLERTNARHLSRAHIPQPLDMVVCDASFISLKTVLPAVLDLTKPGGWLAALIKPQFEVDKAQAPGGVVRDADIRAVVNTDICRWLEERGWSVQGTVESPVAGPKGNIETVVVARRT